MDYNQVKRNYHPLTRDEELAALNRNDRQLLAQSQLPLVRSIVKTICKRWRFRDVETAMCGGLLGLAKAIEYYDGSTKLSSFSYQWIERCTMQEIAKHGRQVSGVQENMRKAGISVGVLDFEIPRSIDPQKVVEHQDTLVKLNHVIDTMPDIDQELLQERLDGATFREMGAKHGMDKHYAAKAYSSTLRYVHDHFYNQPFASRQC